MRRHHGRIPYLHLKSVDGPLRAKVAAEDIPFAKAVSMDVFVEPSAGAVDFLAFRDVLREIDSRVLGSSKTCMLLFQLRLHRQRPADRGNRHLGEPVLDSGATLERGHFTEGSRHRPGPSDTYMQKPVGRGQRLVRFVERLIGCLLPSTEGPSRSATVPWGAYLAIAFSSVGRGGLLRLNYAGGYDQSWIDNPAEFGGPSSSQDWPQSRGRAPDIPIPIDGEVAGEAETGIPRRPRDSRSHITMPEARKAISTILASGRLREMEPGGGLILRHPVSGLRQRLEQPGLVRIDVVVRTAHVEEAGLGGSAAVHAVEDAEMD